jgi:recombination protein RecT
MAAQATASTDVVQRTPTQEALAQLRHPSFLEQIKNALPGNVTPERFVRVAITAIQQTPELVTADRKTLFGAIVRCAQDGLLPDGREAALTTRGKVRSTTASERQASSPCTCR